MKDRQKIMLSTPVIVLRLFALVWLAGTGILSALLLLVADTWPGRIFGLAAVCVAVLPLASITALAGRAKGWIRLTAIMGGLLLSLLFVLLLKAKPADGGSANGRVTSQFTQPLSGWTRWSPANLVPEGDQLALGFTLMTWADPLLTMAQAAKLRQVTAPLYREQAGDPDFDRLGTIMSETYAEMAGWTSGGGHSYFYVPNSLDRTRPAPVFVFFHGSGGNFKAYLWILAEVAERTGCVLLTPSNGMGFWREGQSAAALEVAMRAASRATAIDRARVHVAGLSNGGRAVSQVGDMPSLRLESLIFLSPVFDVAHVASPAFGRLNRERRVLVITGSEDDRVPLAYVEGNVQSMVARGARVELHAVADADHFLMFTHRRLLVDALVNWISQSAKNR